MNALAMVANDPLNSLLAINAAPRNTESGSGFLNLVQLNFDTPESEPPTTQTAATVASPVSSQKIADALIRSMMATPAMVASPTTISPATTAPGAKTARPPSAVASRSANNNEPAAGRSPKVAGIASPAVDNDDAIKAQEESASTTTTLVATNLRPAKPDQEIAALIEEGAVPAAIQNVGSQTDVLPPSTSIKVHAGALREAFGKVHAAQTESADMETPSLKSIRLAMSPVIRNFILQTRTEPGPAPTESEGAAQPQASPVPAQENQTSEFTLQTPELAAPAITWAQTPLAVSQVKTQAAKPALASVRLFPTAPAGENTRVEAAVSTPTSPRQDASLETVAPGQKDPSEPPTASDSRTRGMIITPLPAILDLNPSHAGTVARGNADASRIPSTAISLTEANPAGATDPAPLAFSARLTPVEPDFPPVTPSPTGPAAEQEAMPEAPLPSAAAFSQAPVARPQSENEVQSSAKTWDTNKDDVPAQSSPAGPASQTKSREAQDRETPAPSAQPAAATTHDFGGSPENPAPPSAPALAKSLAPESSAAKPDASPVSDVAEALRTSELAVPACAPASSTPAQQIAVRISQPDAAPVDLHVSERGGEIQVSVRTADPAMQTSLRQDLGTLSASLERAGYRAEMFAPREITAVAANESTQQTSTNLRDDREQPGSGGREGSSGNSSNGRQQQQQPSRDQRQASWLEELENSK